MQTRVVIVTGFLGTGKTTLIKQILKSSGDLSKTILLVNEFGKTGIDASLVKSTATADIVELNHGCICCSLKTDLIKALHSLWHEYTPERLIIEATGVADPLGIIQALEDTKLSPYFRLEKTITIVDSEFWEAREAFGYVFKSQIKQADIILLNKIDTIDESRVPVILKELNKESTKSQTIPTLHCNIAPDIIWSQPPPHHPGMVKNQLFSIYNPEFDCYSQQTINGAGTAKDNGFISFSFKSTQPMDEERFTEFINNLPLELFRIKGPVRFTDRTQMLNYVGGKDQWLKWQDQVSTCLVFIGWNVMEAQILKKLSQCLDPS